MSPPKLTQFHTPPISSQKSPAHQPPQKGRNVFAIPGHKQRYQEKDFAPNPEPWLSQQKEVYWFALLNPLKGSSKGASTEQGGKEKRSPPGNRPRLLKLYRELHTITCKLSLEYSLSVHPLYLSPTLSPSTHDIFNHPLSSLHLIS